MLSGIFGRLEKEQVFQIEPIYGRILIYKINNDTASYLLTQTRPSHILNKMVTLILDRI